MLNNSIVEIAQENLFTITPVITSVILVTLILATIYIIYYFKLKKVKENVRGVIVTNDKGEVTSFTTKKDIIAELTKLKQILLPNKD